MDAQQRNINAPTRSLATTLALALILMSVTALLIDSAFQLFSNIRSQQAAISGNQQLIALGAANTVSSFIQDQFGALETAAQLTSSATASDANWERTLPGLLGLQPSFKYLVMLDANGQPIARASRASSEASGQFIADLTGDRLREILQSSHYIGPVFIDPLTSEPQVVIATPVMSLLGDRQGTLVAAVNLKFMWDLVDQLKIGETGHAYVVDRQGALLAFGDTARVLRGENVSHIPIVQAFATAPISANMAEMINYTGITGATMVGSYVPLGTPDWAVVTEMPWEEAYSGIIRDIGLSIGILALTVALAGVSGVYLARRLTKPLVTLINVATRIADGERELQVQVGGAREIANLATVFNRMTSQLQTTLEGLEQRVAQRTVDLETALEEVRARSNEQELLLKEISAQRQVILELSVPILPVSDGTLVMPLIGALDSARLADIREHALQAIDRYAARRLLLDVTGVPVVDTGVARGLINVAQASRLLGAEVVLIGIRPEVAQTIVSLGLDLSSIPTAADLRTALGGGSYQARSSKAPLKETTGF